MTEAGENWQSTRGRGEEESKLFRRTTARSQFTLRSAVFV